MTAGGHQASGLMSPEEENMKLIDQLICLKMLRENIQFYQRV